VAADTPRCQRCLLPTTIPCVSLDGAGTCSVCNDPAEQQFGQLRQAAQAQMAELFSRTRRDGAGPYDVLALVSGGGDSAYLLERLVHEHHLRPLALFLVEAVGKVQAAQNARQIAKILGVDWMAFTIEADFTKRWVREGLPLALDRELGPHAGRDLFVHLRRALSCNLALRLAIPIVAEGIMAYQGPEQLVVQGADRRQFFCHTRKRRILRELLGEIFGTTLSGSLYDLDAAAEREDLPAVVFPHAISGYSRPAARQRLAQLGLPASQLRGYDTNADINPFVSCFSYAAHDCHVNIEPMARQVRRLGFLHAGRRKLERAEALDFLTELKDATLYFAARERQLPDELDAYAGRFPRLRELFGDDEVFLGRVRRKRQVRALAKIFGMILPQAEG